MSIQKIETSKAPAAVGPYSQGIKYQGQVYISGQMPIDMATGRMCEGTIAEQTKCCLENAAAVAEAAGTSLESAIKTTVFLTAIQDFAEVNQEYAKHFGSVAPARSCFAVASLPKNSKIEIEIICAE